jgi:hypothetical protein
MLTSRLAASIGTASDRQFLGHNWSEGSSLLPPSWLQPCQPPDEASLFSASLVLSSSSSFTALVMSSHTVGLLSCSTILVMSSHTVGLLSWSTILVMSSFSSYLSCSTAQVMSSTPSWVMSSSCPALVMSSRAEDPYPDWSHSWSTTLD